MNRRWDVIVVGARLAGAATAMLLARAGLNVLCLDRARYGSDTLSTHALMRGGVLQLQRWQFLDALVAAGTPPVRRTVFHYDSAVTVSIKPSGGVDALYAPRRTVLDVLLVDASIVAGAVVEFGVHVTRVHRDHTGSVDGVVIKDRRLGSEWTVRAPVVIGADGRDSLVARQVEAETVCSGQHAGSFLYGYWTGLVADGYEWLYRPGLTAGLIPTNDGLTCAFIGGPQSDLEPHVRNSTAAQAFALLSRAVGLHTRAWLMPKEWMA